MKYKPTPKLLIVLGLLALGFVATRSGARSGYVAPRAGAGYGVGGYGGFDPRLQGYSNPGSTSGGGSHDAWYGGDFYGNSNLGTAVSSSGGSGYIAVGGGDFVSW